MFNVLMVSYIARVPGPGEKVLDQACDKPPQVPAQMVLGALGDVFVSIIKQMNTCSILNQIQLSICFSKLNLLYDHVYI